MDALQLMFVLGLLVGFIVGVFVGQFVGLSLRKKKG